ncbi:MAG: lamin tail domain-containing protein [Acidimicrobiales bacterium]
MRHLAVVAVFTVVGTVGGCDDTEPAVAPEPSVRPPAGAERVEVLAVSDGDSFLVERADGNQARVRLLGINAPEQGECLADGEFVNQALVERGLALAGSFEPDVAHQGALDAAEDSAQAAGIAQWNPNACGPAASTAVRIVRTEGDPPGPDDADLNGEYIVVGNTGAETIDLSGWMLRDSSSQNRFMVPGGFTLGPGDEVTVRTGSGHDSGDTLFWGLPDPVWDNDGDTALLIDPSGNVVSHADVPPAD